MNYFDEVIDIAVKIEKESNNNLKVSCHIEKDSDSKETFYILKINNKKQETEFVYYDLNPPRFELLIHHFIVNNLFRRFTNKIIKTQ